MTMVSCVLLNIVAVKWYGEAEFVMASTKIILLFMLVMITFVTMVRNLTRLFLELSTCAP